MTIDRIPRGNYNALIRYIFACANRPLRQDAKDELYDMLESIGDWNAAVNLVKQFCRQSPIPANIINGIDDLWQAQSRAIAATSERSAPRTWDDPDPIRSPEWHALFDAVHRDIRRYHVGDVARWDSKNLLVAALADFDPADVTVPQGYGRCVRLCPVGWYPVVQHFCVAAWERDAKVWYDETCTLQVRPIYDEDVHDPMWARVEGDETREMDYMRHYRGVLAEIRKRRGVDETDETIDHSTLKEIV